MNAYFSKLAEELTGKESIPPDQLTRIIDNMPLTTGEKFQLREVLYGEVEKALSSVRKDCSSGYDNISIRLLQPVLEFLISPLTHIINSCSPVSRRICSLRFGRYPELVLHQKLKIQPGTTIIDQSPFCPCYQRCSRAWCYNKCKNLLIIAVCFRILSRDLARSFNYHCSVEDDLTKAMKNGEITLAIFADFSKAFNSVDPEVLINKLFKMNFSKTFLHWLANYLTDRKQYVQVNDKLSSRATKRFGVPQESLLGPVLFNMYACCRYASERSSGRRMPAIR